jgi:hypothetical protein
MLRRRFITWRRMKSERKCLRSAEIGSRLKRLREAENLLMMLRASMTASRKKKKTVRTEMVKVRVPKKLKAKVKRRNLKVRAKRRVLLETMMMKSSRLLRSVQVKSFRNSTSFMRTTITYGPIRMSLKITYKDSIEEWLTMKCFL